MSGEKKGKTKVRPYRRKNRKSNGKHTVSGHTRETGSKKKAQSQEEVSHEWDEDVVPDEIIDEMWDAEEYVYSGWKDTPRWLKGLGMELREYDEYSDMGERLMELSKKAEEKEEIYADEIVDEVEQMAFEIEKDKGGR